MSTKSFHWLENLDSSNSSNEMKIQQTMISDRTQDSSLKDNGHTRQQEDAEAEVWQGIKLEQENKLAEAIACYRHAVELNSQSAVAHHILAIALKKQGNFAEADYYHRLAVSLGHNNQLDSSKNIEKDYSNSDKISQNLVGNLDQDRDLNSIKNTTSIVKSDSKIVLPKLTAIAPGSYVENNQLEVAQVYLGQAKIYYADAQWYQCLDACEQALKVCSELPETYKLYGNCLQQIGKFAEAMGYYAKALTKDPNLAEVYANIGSLYVKQAQWQQAIDYYQKALAIQPNMAKVRLHLARAWEKTGEDETALSCLLEATKVDPQILNISQYLQLGAELIAEGKIQLAITCYEQGAKITPPNKTLYLQLIKTLEQDRQWKKAADYHSILNQLESEDASQFSRKQRITNLLTANNSGNKYLLPGKSSSENIQPASKTIAQQQSSAEVGFKAQVSQYLEQLQQQPNSLTIRLKLADLFASQHQWQPAINYYQQAIQIEPHSATAYLKLGKIYGTLGKTIPGAELIYKGFSLEPELVSAKQHEQLGDFWVKHHRLELAANCYRQAVRLKPESKTALSKLQQLIKLETTQVKSLSGQEPKSSDKSTTQPPAASQSEISAQKAQAYLNLAAQAEKEENWELAQQYYYQAIEEQGDNQQAYYRAGAILHKQQQWQKLIELFQQAINHNPQEYSYHHNLGDAYLESQQWEQAIACFRKAIELNPKFSWSHFKMGEAFMELQQWQAAAEAIGNSIKLKSDFDWAHHKLGDVATQLKDWDTAVKAYKDALKITPDLPKTEEKLANAIRRRLAADQKQIQSFYENAVEANPDQESSYFQALEVQSDNSEHYVKLAQIYESQGRLSLAFAFYKIALQLAPDNPEIQAKLNSLRIYTA